tara:strand:+ start:559 stop:696 length:138 start_codon:yes stop_codon:yes gene_type:complete
MDTDSSDESEKDGFTTDRSNYTTSPGTCCTGEQEFVKNKKLLATF